MDIAAEAVTAPGLDALMPAWAQQLSLLGLLILIVTAWMRGWVLTRSQAERELEGERKIGVIWKNNFEQSQQLNQQLTGAFQPVLESNAAILKVVESLQARQIEQDAREERRAERDSWLRDRRDSEG